MPTFALDPARVPPFAVSRRLLFLAAGLAAAVSML